MKDSAMMVLEFDAPHYEASPCGGLRFGSSFGGRSYFGVVRRIPGRLVYVKDVAGERRAVGWVAIDTDRDLISKVIDLMVWLKTTKDID